jgi:hypothetical protein
MSHIQFDVVYFNICCVMLSSYIGLRVIQKLPVLGMINIAASVVNALVVYSYIGG